MSPCPRPGLSASAEGRACCQPGPVPTLSMLRGAEDTAGRLAYGAMGGGGGRASTFIPPRRPGQTHRERLLAESEEQSLVQRAGAQMLGL